MKRPGFDRVLPGMEEGEKPLIKAESVQSKTASAKKDKKKSSTPSRAETREFQIEEALPLERPGLGQAPPSGEEEEKPAIEGEPILPEVAPAEKDKGKLFTLPRIVVREFRFEGNTAITDAELSEIAAPYAKREITFEELQELRYKLTLFYVNRGYISSGVVIPDQKIADGVVVFKVVEGVLTDIRVEGTKHLVSRYITSRLRLNESPVVNIHDLQKSLELLRQNPLIKKINAQFGPGVLPRESILKVKVEEEDPFNVWLEFNNAHSPSIGEMGSRIMLNHQNVFGIGDAFNAGVGKTEGLFDWDLSYALPLHADDTTLKVQYRKSDSVVVEELFQNLNIQSRVDTLGITLSRPFYRTANRTLNLGVTGELRHSVSYLLGRKYSFSQGEVNGEADVSALRFFQEWTDRTPEQVIAARSTFSLGGDAFGSTVNSTGPDSEFFTWLGQFQWIRRFGGRGDYFVCRTDTQLSARPILPLEKFSIGGAQSVRAYRSNRLARDNGLSTSMEVRLPILKTERQEALLSLAPFIDYGRSWNTGAQTSGPKELLSVGAGLRMSVAKRISMELYGGVPLKNKDKESTSIQDKGFHFQITGTLF